MNDLAIFGNVLTKDELAELIDRVVGEAQAEEPLEAGEVAELRERLKQAVAPMVVCVCDDPHVPLTTENFLPETWGGKFMKWMWDVKDKRIEAFTHVVLFESLERKDVVRPLYFDGKPIMAPFAICTYNERTDTYLRIHCQTCAVTIIDWITSRQMEWTRAQGDAEAPKAKTHDAPARLQ